MAYTPQQWHDDTTSDPYGPISGDRLNYIEAGIAAAAGTADAALAAAGSATSTPLGTAAPIINGVAAAGTSGSAAHEDHVHPTDTTRAALASPTFTGHPVGVTEAALNNSTRLATTAYTDTAVGVETTRASTAEALLAPLASPTLTGTPSLPTGATGVTQSAADSTTKLATTAFVTTADNLKANLASPTFTGTATIPTIAGPTTLAGTVTLPSTTVAVTPSASDNSTKPATTAYVDTADNLKANLASPAFTGHPTGVTEAVGNSTTRLASTAFVAAAPPPMQTLYNGGNTFREPFPRDLATSTPGIPATGIMLALAVPLYAGDVITNIAFRTGTTGTTSPTHYWFALYDNSASPLLLSQTADQGTAAWASGTVKDLALGTAQTIATTGLYYVGMMIASSGQPIMVGSSPLGSGASSMPSGIVSGQAIIALSAGSSLTATAPGTVTLTAANAVAQRPYFVCH